MTPRQLLVKLENTREEIKQIIKKTQVKDLGQTYIYYLGHAKHNLDKSIQYLNKKEREKNGSN